MLAASEELREGDIVTVRGRVHTVYAKEGLVEVTFAPWWPRWSAILVKLELIDRVAPDTVP